MFLLNDCNIYNITTAIQNPINSILILVNSEITPTIHDTTGVAHNAPALNIEATLGKYSPGTLLSIIICSGKFKNNAPTPNTNISIDNATYIANCGKVPNKDSMQYDIPTIIPPNINIFLFPIFSFILGAKTVEQVIPTNVDILITDIALLPEFKTLLHKEPALNYMVQVMHLLQLQILLYLIIIHLFLHN